MKKANLYNEEQEYVVDEKLGTYFECMSVWDRKFWLANEIHMSQTLGISTMGKWTMEQLRTAHSGTKVLKNAPCYEILSN